MKSQCEMNTALPLASAIVCLCYNALTVLLCSNLPSDPFQLASYIYMYSMFGCVSSAIGIYGVAMRRPDLIRSFSRFLLVDAFMSVVCRMLLEEFFVETLYESNVCSFDDNHWSSINPSYAIVRNARLESKFKRLFDSPETCNIALAGLHFIAIAAMILTSAAQISLAVVMQKFAKQMEVVNRYHLWTIVEVDEKAEDLEAFPDALSEKQRVLLR